MDYTKTTLKNGLTVILCPMKDASSVTVLVTVSAGSKYESREQNGLSHFLEHMCFKGTTKRPNPSSIALELDSIGSQNNAFTFHEFTGYYAKSHPTHLATILDVVSDIYTNQIFDTKEIEREKGVIVEEINMYEDLPHRLVQDLFMETLYGDQPAGWSILGTKEKVKAVTQSDLVEYRRKHYVASATTVTVCGNFDEASIVADIEKAFAQVPTGEKGEKVSVSEVQQNPVIQIRDKATDQAHIVLGVRGYPATDEKNIAMKVLNSVLGGGMSSRLWQKLREEMGVGYYVSSGVEEFSDHGIFSVSCGVDTSRIEEVVKTIIDEFKKVVEEKISPSELKKAKDYMIGNMYLALESSDSVAEYYAMQNIISPELLKPSELAQKIEQVTAEQIQAVAQEVMQNNRLNMAIIGKVFDRKNLESIFHF